jgi:hypothetical protein
MVIAARVALTELEKGSRAGGRLILPAMVFSRKDNKLNKGFLDRRRRVPALFLLGGLLYLLMTVSPPGAARAHSPPAIEPRSVAE